MKGILAAVFSIVGLYASAQDYPAADQKWVSTHTLMATGRATGKRSPEITKKLRRDYSRIVRNERQIKKYSREYHKQLDQQFKKTDHSARWVLRHKNQLAQKG